jgi:integrase
MRLYKRGRLWWCEFRVNKVRYQYSCKTDNYNLANELAAARYADVLRENANLPKKLNKQLFLSDVWKQYQKNLSNSKETIRSKVLSAKHFLPVFGDKDIKFITKNQIIDYQYKRKLETLSLHPGKREQEVSFRSVNIEITTLHHFFNWCIDRGYLDKNPAAGIKKLNELSRLKTLSDSDIQKLIAGATNKLTRDLITFLIYTGCRKGEALNLKWDDVDMQNDVIAIKGTKTKYDRYIPISKPLKELLSRIEKVQDVLYVFNRNGAKLSDFKRSFHTACRNAGLKDMHIHDLRHVFASTLTMNDVSLYKTGILLGHRTPNMTQRYAHLKPGELKKEIEKAFGRKSQEDLKRAEYERALEIIREYEKGE